MLVAGTGAVSRYKLSRSQKFVKVQDFNCGQMRVSGCNEPLQICLECRSKSKKCDKQLTHIVRVRFRGNFINCHDADKLSRYNFVLIIWRVVLAGSSRKHIY